MPRPIVDITPPPPDPRQAISLTLINTPDGVLVRADGDLSAYTPQASVARSLCRFADTLFQEGLRVRVGPEIVKAVL